MTPNDKNLILGEKELDCFELLTLDIDSELQNTLKLSGLEWFLRRQKKFQQFIQRREESEL